MTIRITDGMIADRYDDAYDAADRFVASMSRSERIDWLVASGVPAAMVHATLTGSDDPELDDLCRDVACEMAAYRLENHEEISA